MNVRVAMVLALVAAAAFAPRPAFAGVGVGQPREVTKWQARQDSLHPVVHRELGILLGTPALINLAAGYWFHPVFGVRASGMFYAQRSWGAQGGLCVTLSRSDNRRTALALVGGSIHTGGSYFDYAGPVVDWNRSAFFLEIGPVYLKSNDANYLDRHFGIIMQGGFMGGGGIRGPR